MRVGLDHFPAATHAPGIGRYARELTRALVALQARGAAGELDLRLLDWGRGPRVMSEASLGLGTDTRRLRVALPARSGELLGRLGLGSDRLLGGLERFHHVRLHGPPVSRARQSFALSEWPRGDGEAAFLRRLEDFDDLLVFSEEYRQRVLERVGFDAERVHLVPVGADHWLRDLGRAPEACPRSVPARVLVLGAPFPERRHRAILAACEELARGGLELELFFAGRPRQADRELVEAVGSSSLGARLTWRNPQEAELPELVATSSLLVHLCDEVGTAVTPLESLLAGVPVLLSPVPAFREVLGAAAHWTTAFDAPSLAGDIEAALGVWPDESVRVALRERFSWRANAVATLSAWGVPGQEGADC